MRTIALSDDLYERVSNEAGAHGMTVEQLVAEALTSYLAVRQFDRLSDYGRKQADELDLTEEDVSRLTE
jgi:hypothetical protein